MTLRLAVLASIALAAACRSTGEIPPPVHIRAAAQPAPRSEADVLAASLPGVVLVVNHRPDGAINFGSGILLDEAGRVLTNMHVVAHARSLGVMFHDPRRTSYIPQEGGLGRYLFENEKDIVPAVLQRGEPVLDLAVIKVDADTSRYPRLPLRTEPVRVGERVIALGHPNETVWSFTAGMVSALPSGMIQTDAAINRGNSGGPLIDVRGRVVGVNTSKLFGDSQGVAFARPIALAKELIEETTGALELDLSTVEKAFSSCNRAWEMGSASVAECLDEESYVRASRETFSRVTAMLRLQPGHPLLTAIRAQIDSPKAVARARKMLVLDAKAAPMSAWMGWIRSGMSDAGPLEGEPDARARIDEILGRRAADEKALREAMKKTEPYLAAVDQKMFERTGMKIDSRNPSSMRELRRMGLRIEEVRRQGDRAWIRVGGRNLDGSKYAYSELWFRRGTRWLPAATTFEDDRATLPPGFPPPLWQFEADAEQYVARLQSMLASRRSKDAAKRPHERR